MALAILVFIARLFIAHPSEWNLTMLKAAIALMLIATVVSLFSGLFFLVKDEGNSNRLVTALTVRVVLAAITVGLIAWGFLSGQLVSHAPW
jgi:FtsH-binding integral membrane protein